MILKDPKLICVVSDELKNENYFNLQLKSLGYKTEYFESIPSAMSIFSRVIPSLLLIDLDKDNRLYSEHCFNIKSNSNYHFTKVIFVASATDERSEVQAFSASADDFLFKPVRIDGFIQRLIIRLDQQNLPIAIRSEHKEEARIYIDKESFTVYINQLPITVSRKEFELLHLMASHPGKIFTRDEIFEKVWKRKANPKDRTIDVHILRLRKKLGDEFISTQKGVGYRFRTS